MRILVIITLITIGYIGRAYDINRMEVQKDEDAYFPIKRRISGRFNRFFQHYKKHYKIIRRRAVLECYAILLNGLLFVVTASIVGLINGNMGFLHSTPFMIWIGFTVLQIPLWEIGVKIYIKCCILFKKERIQFPVSDPDKSILELSELATPAIDKIIISENIYLLNAYKTIYCLRDKGEYNRVVYYMDPPWDPGMQVHFFDKKGNERFSNYFWTLECDKEQLTALQPGTSITRVKELDPNGYYGETPYGYTGRISLHCTNDGFWIEIRYNHYGNIEEISSELI